MRKTIRKRQLKSKKDPHLNEKGQALIVVATMTLVFISLFTFVVHTGILVNARINLQNAADMAAFSGAAVQARQLNRVGHINYEMRRQMKKFLFRYYLLGNIAQKSHYKMSGEATPRRWYPGDDEGNDYGVPAVCMIFNKADNYCQLDKLPAIPKVVPNPFDTITQTLAAGLERIEQIRQQNCKSAGAINLVLLAMWLFNTDPELEVITETLQGNPNPLVSKSVLAIKGLAAGLGLVPKMVLLGKRLETAASYLNYPPQKGITFDDAQDLASQTSDPAEVERTVQAFNSAYFTLGEWNFAERNITMDELLPESGDGSNLLEVLPIKSDFESYYVDFEIEPSPTNADEQDCVPNLLPVPIKGMTVGYFKNPEILTYYAVRLKAKVNLLYSPFGEIEMNAYAAAQPFGSRIGPSDSILLTNVGSKFPFTTDATPNTGEATDCLGQECNGILNLPVTDWRDGLGWQSEQVLQAMYNRLLSSNGAAGGNGEETRVLSSESLESAYSFAMMPNPSERGYYVIPNDLDATPGDPTGVSTGSPFIRHFPNPSSPEKEYVWAPLLSASDSSGDPTEFVTQELEKIENLDPQLRDTLSSQMRNYVSLLRAENGQGTDFGETETRMVLFNPLRDQATRQLIITSEPIVMDGRANPFDIKSSWNNLRNQSFTARGRTGYSVKLVSFPTLRSGGSGVTTDGTNGWANTVDNGADRQFSRDVGSLRH